MPKTSIDKYGDVQFWEYKVGATKNASVSPPTNETMLTEQFDQA